MSWRIAMMMALVATTADAAPWFCTSSNNANVGSCKPNAASCNAFRTSQLERVTDLEPCAESYTVACFELAGEPHCAPSIVTCEALRHAASQRFEVSTCTLRDAEAPPPPRGEHDDWYTGTMMAIDVPGTVLTLTLGSFVISPIVHLAKGNPRSAAISLGLHLALPIGFATIGHATAPRTCNTGGDMGCDFGPTVSGYLLGVVSAMVIDYTVLSHRTVGAAFVPTVSHDTASLSLVGAF